MSPVEITGCFWPWRTLQGKPRFSVFLALIIWLHDYIGQIFLEDLHIGVTKMDFVLSPKKTWPKLLVMIVINVLSTEWLIS